MPQEFSLFDECKANARAYDALPDIVKALEKSEQKIKQLCDMVNTYSNMLKLGDKVRTEHWVDDIQAALKKGGF